MKDGNSIPRVKSHRGAQESEFQELEILLLAGLYVFLLVPASYHLPTIGAVRAWTTDANCTAIAWSSLRERKRTNG
jgi:hypothetical protein